MDRRLIIPGSLLWIAGLICSIVGMNLAGNAGSWLQVGGNIAFFIGLLLTGAAWWLHRREADRRQREAENDEGPMAV